jgi:hypothetical protein
VVSGNRALAGLPGSPTGRFAEGAGIMVDNFFSGPPDTTCVAPRPACQFDIRDSAVTGNTSRLTTTIPLFASGGDFALLANGGGIHVGDHIPTTVERTAIDGNAAISSDLQGEASSIDGGMLIGASPLFMRDSQVNHNLTATTAQTVADVSPVGDALEIDGWGTIVGTSVDGNVATTVSPGGVAGTTGGLGVFDTDLLTVKNSTISDNVTLARSDTGSASVLGAGVFNNTLLTMDHVVVSHNTGRASGPDGIAQGGGIWNGDLITGPPALTLLNSIVVGNTLETSPGIPRQGGGVFTTFPVVRVNTLIAGNRPDQCTGCSLMAGMARPAAASRPARARTYVRARRGHRSPR